MTTGVQSWNQTAALNASSDSTVNWAEGQAPSTVNDSARAMMASVAKFRDDIGGGIVTTGTGAAYAVTSFEGIPSLAAGFFIAFTPHTSNTGTCTINVDGLGARPLRPSPGAEFAAGVLVAGKPYTATFAATGEWIVHSTPSALVGGSLSTTGSASIGGTLGVTSNTTVGGTLGVTGATSLSTFSSSGAGAVGGTLTVTGALGGTSAAYSAGVTVGTTLGVTGATTLSSLSTTGNASIGGTLAVTGSFSPSNLIATNAAKAFLRYNGGIVTGFNVNVTGVSTGAITVNFTGPTPTGVAVASLEGTSAIGSLVVQWVDSVDIVVRTFNTASTLTSIPFNLVVF